MTEEKKLKIEFAPGAFDSFEGTQEELDEMIAEIQTMFAELTPEELEARSCLVDDETLSPEEFEKIMQSLTGDDARKLQ